jgi:hypothetical protein
MANTPFEPTPKFVKFMAEILRLEQRKIKKLDNLPKTIRNNDEKKVRWLDNLFTTMANVIYFFEFINTHPELMDRFGDDIEDLLGLKPILDPQHAPFPRFLRAVIGEGNPSDIEDSKFNYRYRLLKIMQYLINQKALQYYANPDNPTYQKDTRFKDTVWRDLLQAELWLTNIDKITVDKNKKPSRIMDF